MSAGGTEGTKELVREINYVATAMNLRAIRMRKGYRVGDVAKAMGVNPSAVTHWENGETLPSTVKLIKLADLYGIPVDNLIIRRVEQ